MAWSREDEGNNYIDKKVKNMESEGRRATPWRRCTMRRKSHKKREDEYK